MEILRSAIGFRVGSVDASDVQALVAVLVAWLAIVFVVLQVLGSLTIENYYVLSYFGLVVTAYLFAPTDPTVRWWRVVRWLLRIGLLVLCYLVWLQATAVIQV